MFLIVFAETRPLRLSRPIREQEAEAELAAELAAALEEAPVVELVVKLVVKPAAGPAVELAVGELQRPIPLPPAPWLEWPRNMS